MYLPWLIILFLGISDYGREYHSAKLPATAAEALKNHTFNSLETEKKRSILSRIGSDFAGLPSIEQNKVLEILNKKTLPSDLPIRKYSYSGYHTWNLKGAIGFTAIFSSIYILIMEVIKRAFYYVVLGKIFPKG